MESKNNLTQSTEKKPMQKCVGFSRKIGKTNYEVSGFYTDTSTETMEGKIKRILREEVKEKFCT